MTKCDVCGHGFGKPAVIALTLTIGPGKHSEMKRTLRIFGKQTFNICFPCWIESLGVKRVKK